MSIETEQTTDSLNEADGTSNPLVGNSSAGSPSVDNQSGGSVSGASKKNPFTLERRKPPKRKAAEDELLTAIQKKLSQKVRIFESINCFSFSSFF